MQTDTHTPRAAGGSIAWLGFGAMVLLYLLSFFQRTAVPGTVFDEIQSECGLSASAVTALGTLFVYVYGGMQVGVGFIADRFGGRRAILLGGAAMALGGMLFPLCHQPWALYAARALTGLGACFMYLCIIKEAHALFPARLFTRLVGGAIFFGFVGGMLGTLPLQRVVAVTGWRTALFGAGALTALATLAAWAMLRRVPPEAGATPAPLDWRLLREVLRNRRSRPLLLSGLWSYPVFFVIQATLGKKYLQDVVGLTAGAAAAFTLAMAAASAVSVFAGGWVITRFGQRRKPCLLVCGSAALLATLLLLGGTLRGAPPWVFLTAYVLLAVTNASSPALAAVMKELNRPQVLALSVAALNGLCYVGAGLLGTLSGAILDLFRARATATPSGLLYPREAYAWVFACLVLSAAGCLLLYARTPETHGRSLADGKA